MTNTKVLQQQLNFLAPSARILQGDGRLESVPLNDDLGGGVGWSNGLFLCMHMKGKCIKRSMSLRQTRTLIIRWRSVAVHEKKLIIHYSRSAGIRSRFASVMGNPVVAHKNNHSHSPQRNEVIGTRRLCPICSGWAARCCAIVVGAITATDANCPLVWLSSRQVKRKNSPSLLMLSVFLHGETLLL